MDSKNDLDVYAAIALLWLFTVLSSFYVTDRDAAQKDRKTAPVETGKDSTGAKKDTASAKKQDATGVKKQDSTGVKKPAKASPHASAPQTMERIFQTRNAWQQVKNLKNPKMRQAGAFPIRSSI